jgi:hypothetical protein
MEHVSRWSTLKIRIYWEMTNTSEIKNAGTLIDVSKRGGLEVNRGK